MMMSVQVSTSLAYIKVIPFTAAMTKRICIVSVAQVKWV
jgi:hypothetical protein